MNDKFGERNNVEEDVVVARASSPDTTEELIQFHFDVLSTLLQQVVAQRAAHDTNSEKEAETEGLLTTRFQSKSMAIDEISEVIHVPNLDNITDVSQTNSDSENGADRLEASLLSPDVKSQLGLYIARIADMYLGSNPFHNFSHASHVTFSAFQLLRRIVARDIAGCRTPGGSSSNEKCHDDADPWKSLPFELQESSDVLASNSLAQFALIFSALIHDVDHRGVSNTQLAKENPDVASKYQFKSIAEQNSVDIAWELLEEESFRDLRAAIFSTKEERAHFRNMVVNVVLATDICDPGLREFRERKWAKASQVPIFEDALLDDGLCQPSSPVEERSRKASVVMDLIIQAADISHTMQPFDVYLQWNERLYREMYNAYRKGRSQYNPSDGKWYQGELMFYDKHIIPLASRLKDSGMFGQVGDTLLENAQENRTDWEIQGLELAAKMHAETERRFHLVTDNEESLSPARRCRIWPSFLCCRSRRTLLAKGKRSQSQPDREESETDDESDDESSIDQSCLLGSSRVKAS
eukprot:CAMPEP_0117066846 /NCGR_PEP_ID=MMETSP0472-20121206/46772_1 /TAXON_ID=693140 ORGANISM="Tiarina fusus, Strain LIS" /NCGR_SAMPLE_ID=MMETSP0472 /ASSEMBLY_ACC=CAM_ASM_000603 /LENGTH=524 /DNA_ID=CAMNT_0004788115 /DNA_START=158 /DNA_END=1734 /DNA_ORIENTATION=-